MTANAPPVATDPAAWLRPVLRQLSWPALLVDDGRIDFANRAALQLVGADARSLRGRSPMELLQPDAREPSRRSGARSRPGKAAWHIAEDTLLRSDGSTRRIETAVARLPGGLAGQQIVLMRDISAQQQIEAALQRSQAELRRLSARRDARHEQDRRRLARALHDELQQALAAMRMELGAMAERGAGGDPALADTLARVNQVAIAAGESARRIANELQPPILEELGLAAALASLTARCGRETGVRHRFRTVGVAGGDAGEADAQATCLYRVAEEALSNIAAHARASCVRVVLARLADGRLAVRVSDDGVGMPAQANSGDDDTVGLLSMKERVRALNGQCCLHPGRHGGTSVTVVLDGFHPNGGTPADMAAGWVPRADHDALLAFLYQSPIGMVQAALDGRIELLTPVAAQLLLPLAPQGRLDNLFDLLEPALPQLRGMVQALNRECGVVCRALRLQVPAGTRCGSRSLGLDLVKQEGKRLFAVLTEREDVGR